MVYLSTLPNVACRKPIIPHVFIPLTRNVIKQKLVGFPGSMYSCVGPYTPYIGFGYEGIGSALTMWSPMSDPLTNPTKTLWKKSM